MQTLTVDIISNRAFKFLRFLERLKLIRVRGDKSAKPAVVNWEAKYKGKMTKQPLEEIDKQVNDLRNEWE